MVPKSAVLFKSIFLFVFTQIDLFLKPSRLVYCLFYSSEHLVMSCMITLQARVHERKREMNHSNLFLEDQIRMHSRICPIGRARKKTEQGKIQMYCLTLTQRQAHGDWNAFNCKIRSYQTKRMSVPSGSNVSSVSQRRSNVVMNT